MRNSFSFTFNSVTSCDIVEGKIFVFHSICFDFHRAVLQRLRQVKHHFYDESTNKVTHRFEGSVGLIIFVLTCFNLSNTYLGFKIYHIARTFLLPAATAGYCKINALPAGNRPEITVSLL